MDLLNEFFDPIPIPALALGIFALALLWVLSKCFRFPPGFETKEELREEIRYRLFDVQMTTEAEEEAALKKANEAKEATAEAATEAADENKPAE